MLPLTADPYADTQRFDRAAIDDTQQLTREDLGLEVADLGFEVADEKWFAAGEAPPAPAPRRLGHWRCALRAACVLAAATAVLSAVACVM